MGFLGTPLGWIMWGIYSLIENYGISLILFTVIIKVAMFPLHINQQKSTARMAVFQPKLTEIQKKYEKNPQKQQEELQKFYAEHKYNPMSGCLPLLLTFVLLFGVIDVVYNPLEHILRMNSDTIDTAVQVLKDAGISITQPQLNIISYINNNYDEALTLFSQFGPEFVDQVYNFDYSLFGINLGAEVTMAMNWYLLVPILAGATSYLTSWISMKTNPSSVEGQNGGMMKTMMYMSPLMSIWICFSVPVGVGIYWIMSNLLSMIQTVVLHKMYSPAKFKAEYEAQMAAQAEQKKLEREKRKKMHGGIDPEEEAEKELAEKMKEKTPGMALDIDEEGITEKERNRRRLAEARRRDAEKYGEEYIEVNDNDV